MQRRLAAILSADVVGYSRLMGDDEAGTLIALKAHREACIDPAVEAHNGRIVKLMGDGALVEFASVVDAVQCAAAVQDGIAARNAEVPADKRIEFRIGVNLGDVIVEGDDIYGDGVNVAARLQELCAPGGVAVSAVVFDQVDGKLDLAFDGLGEKRAKNIAKPLRVYSARLDGAEPAAADPPAEPLALPDKPSIAVLPFTNLSGDAEQEYLADGITEDVIAALAKNRWFFVIDRNSTFTYKGQTPDTKQVARELGVRYVLEGSVRKAGNRVRVAAQLVDATAGTQVWAERYDRVIEDIFELQDDMTRTIVGVVEPEVRAFERERAARKPPESLVSRFRSSHDFRLVFSGFDCSEAEPLDGGEDVIGGFGPFEGFGVLVCRVDVVEDGALQLLGGAMDAAPDLFVGQQPEPALDLVEPGGAGGCEMGLPARPFGEPVADRLGLVGPVVVHDDVDVEISRDVRLDEVEEFAELSGPMARETFADDLSRGDVEGREERGRAVALVVVAAPLRLPGAHRQEGLGTVQGLDLALFVDTENQGTIRRRQIQTDDVADLLHEEGIARQLEGLRAMRLQAEGPPDAMNGRGRVAARPRHRAKAPMGRVRRRLFQRQPDRFCDGVIADLTRRAGAGFVVQTVEALRRIAATPLAHGVRARLETNGDLLVLQPFRRRQDDPSPPRKPLRRLATTRQRLQFGALVIAQRDRHRHSRHQSRLLKTNRDIIILIYRSGH